MGDHRPIGHEEYQLTRIANALEQVDWQGNHVCVFKNAGLLDDRVTVGEITVPDQVPPTVVQACVCGKVRQVR